LRPIIERDYRLAERFDVEDRSGAARPVFDQQDAFFLPVTGFERFTRPGPTIDIYERQDDQTPRDQAPTGRGAAAR